MNETSKLIEKRKRLGIYDKYFVGSGLEIGGWNDPLIIDGKPITQHTLPDGSSHKLPFADNSFDFIYASHVLEHFISPKTVLREWLRVARNYVYFAVPDFYLYEKGIWPSKFNKNHLSRFDMQTMQELLSDLSDVCTIEFCRIEDNKYDYTANPQLDQTRMGASAQIEVCLKKC